MAFKGWSEAAIEFYDGLEEDNSRSYWQAHKTGYDRDVKAPMDELLSELAAEFGPGRLFRPNRDIRFSADKSPYKTAIGATVGDDGYVQFSGAGLATGRGMYVMAADQLERYRRAVAAEATGAALVALAEQARASGIDITAHARLKTAPRGYPKDHPRSELLCLKGCVAWRQWPVAGWLSTAKAKTRVVEFLRSAEPLSQWLATHVGASTEPSVR